MEAISHNIGHNDVEFNDYRWMLYLSRSADQSGGGKRFSVAFGCSSWKKPSLRRAVQVPMHNVGWSPAPIVGTIEYRA
jgi:hypothetical protein